MGNQIWELTENTKIKFGVELTQIKRVGTGELGGWKSKKAILGIKVWISVNVNFMGGNFMGGNFWGGNFWGGDFMGGNFRGGNFMGGNFWGGNFWGGDFMGGNFRGGNFRGGNFWGGNFWGGDFWGGNFRGGDFRGGDFWGGNFRGGDFRGGDFMGGNFRGGAKIETSADFLAVSPIGSAGGIFTAYRCKVGFNITRGCFHGTPKEFKDAVKKTHGRKKHGKEYALILDLCELKFGKEAFWA